MIVFCVVAAGMWFLIARFCDIRLAGYITHSRIPSEIKDAFRFFNFLYTNFAAILILIWACLIAGPKSEKWRFVIQLALGMVLISIPVWSCKILIPRYRPNPKWFKGSTWHDSFVPRSSIFDILKPDMSKSDLQSFFSGDAAMAFVMAVLLAFHFPRFRSVFWVSAVLCAVSRYVLNAHWASDIFLGMLVGYVVGRLVLLLTGDVRTDR